MQCIKLHFYDSASLFCLDRTDTQSDTFDKLWIIKACNLNQPRKQYACACSFSIDGMHEAVRKSHLVKAKLTNLTSEVEFWDWYKKEIEEESRLVDDRVTFGEAIKIVEDDFWSRPDRRRRKRDKTSASDLSSWHDTYGRFYKWLDPNEEVSLNQINHVISKWDRGTKTYQGVVSAMKKLAEMNCRRDIHEELSMLDVTQTEYKDMQNATLKDFLDWRHRTLGFCTTLTEYAYYTSQEQM